MSDSDGPPPDGSMGGVPSFLPREVQQHLRQQFETMNALNESNVRRQDAFIEGLDEDQLRMTRGMIKAALDDPSFGSYMIGWISAILKIKHNICQYCGDKHATYEDLLTAHPEGDSQ